MDESVPGYAGDAVGTSLGVAMVSYRPIRPRVPFSDY